MQREKPYNLQTKVYFNYILFVFKKETKRCATNFRRCENRSHRIWSVFEHKKYIIKINFNLYIIELFTLHLVVYFLFFNKKYLEIKI
jgi:hypothetical protein